MRWLIFVLLLSGCESRVEYLAYPLDRPERPLLPKIKADDLMCLKQETYQKLYDRQRLITDYAITLETIIDSTQPTPK